MPPQQQTLNKNKVSASQQQAQHNARMSALVRAGALKSNELPMLKLALRKQQQTGDIARLPRNQRDILTRYLQTTNYAATDSQQAFNATKRNIMAHYEHEKGEAILEVRYVPNLYQNPPMMLILKRSGFRIFPDGQRVAIYKNDKTGFVFSVPFNQSFNTNVGTPQGGAAITGQQEEIGMDDESFEELIEAIEDSELEQLDEANVQKMGRVKLIRARVRGGKVQRRKKVSAVKGYTLRGGKLTRMSAKERLDRKRGARRGKIKRKAKLARALIKRKRSLRKRKSLGL